MRACILSGAALFALGMAFHEYLRPIARRGARVPHVHEWVAGYYGGDPVWCSCGLLRPIDDWATDPRTAELATGGGR